ncbi:MAG: nucleotidyltransferase family protein [Pedosphaera sp.]|nr:nucleotidyltransferase family protein [Pedosphaera sp.]
MKAVILAAGKGTRMKDLTQELPKPMLSVQGKPILEHILEGILDTGIRDFCIVTGWRAEVIEQRLGNGSRWGARIQYVHQAVQDGTGKAPELARKFVGQDDFLLTYGDILVKPETYQRMIVRWREGRLTAGADLASTTTSANRFSGLVTVTEGQDVTQGGLLFFDDDFNLSRLVEKPSPIQLDELRQSGWIVTGHPVWYNAGIYLLTPALFEYTARLQKSPRGEYELTDAISEMVGGRRTIAGLKIEGRWVDVRDPEVLASLQGAS